LINIYEANKSGDLKILLVDQQGSQIKQPIGQGSNYENNQ